MTKRIKRDPAAFTDGTLVEYQPVMGPREPWYRGVVRGKPFKLGHGEWVVHLRDMEPAYGEKVRSSESDGALRTHVHAALLQALRLVKPTKAEVVPEQSMDKPITEGSMVEYQPAPGPDEPWFRCILQGAPFGARDEQHATLLVCDPEALVRAFPDTPRRSGSGAIVLVAPVRAMRRLHSSAEAEYARLDRVAARLRDLASQALPVPLGHIRVVLDRTQAHTAAAIGVTAPSISRTEMHPDVATIATLTRYARALGGELEVAVRVLGHRVVVKVPPIGEKRSRAKQKEQGAP